MSRNQVERCLNKALNGGIEFALSDIRRSGKPPQIDAADQTWVVHIASVRNPKRLVIPMNYGRMIYW